MLKIGLTGGIGSGKSTVSRMLKERAIPVIDADIIAREVLEDYPEILTAIKEEFGEEFFDAEGKLLRRKLGNYVFKAEDRKKELESIILPFIKKEIFKRLKLYSDMKEKICIVDAPTLIETGINSDMDFNILVWVDRETQIKRVAERDIMSDEDIIDRINSQMPLDKKKEYADFVIDNRNDIKSTEDQVEKILVALDTI